MTRPDERIFLHDDAELGVRAETDRAVRLRHLRRYLTAIRAAERDSGIWLDIACGSGYAAPLIGSRAGMYIGVDLDPLAIAYARRRYGGSGRLYIEASDFVAWPMLNAWGIRPDVILSVETLEHLNAEAQEPFIANAALALKHTGVLVLCCPISEGPDPPANPHHRYEPQQEEVTEWLRQSFRDVRIEVREYTSTAGVPARQLTARCRRPVRRTDDWAL